MTPAQEKVVRAMIESGARHSEFPGVGPVDITALLRRNVIHCEEWWPGYTLNRSHPEVKRIIEEMEK